MAFDPLSAVLDVGGKLIDRLWPDPTEKAKASLALLQLQQSGELAEISGQLEVNKEEAKSQSVFVSGWRPFVGWVCGSGLGYQFVARPIFAWITQMVGVHKGLDAACIAAIIPPSLDMGTLITLLAGMLGFGGMRTYEKLNDAVTNGH